MPGQGNASIATVRAGGREYPLVSEKTCKTCQSPYRDIIERDTVAGRTWSAIARNLPPDADLTPRNLADHFRNEHLPIAAETTRTIMETQAAHKGELVEEAAAKVLDYLSFAEAVVGRVNTRVANGELEPQISDALRAAELLARYAPESPLEESDYVTAFVIYFETAEDVMTPSQFTELGRRLDAHPVLHDLARRWDERRL